MGVGFPKHLIMMLLSRSIPLPIDSPLVSMSCYPLGSSQIIPRNSRERLWYVPLDPPCFGFQVADYYQRSLLDRGTSSIALESKFCQICLTLSMLIRYSCDGTVAPINYNYTIALPLAKRCDPVSWPGAGHGLNFALNAQGAFQKIADCLNTHNL